MLRETVDEGVLHQAERTEAVGLEQDQQAPGKGVQGGQRRVDLVRIVGEVVDHRHAVPFPDELEPPPEALEAVERRGRIVQRHGTGARGAEGGQRVCHVVPSRHAEAHPRAGGRRALRHLERDAVGRRDQVAGQEIRRRVAQAEADRLVRRNPGGQHGALRIVQVQDHGFGLGGKVAEQRPQLVQRLVVQGDVVQDRDPRAVEGDRAVALVDLADEDIAVADHGAGEGGVGRDEVLHHGAVHDRRVTPDRVQYPAEHPGRGRLAAGAAQGDAVRRGVEYLGQQLGAGHHTRTETPGRLHVGHGVLDRGRGDQDLVGAGEAAAVLGVQRDAASAQKIELLRRPPLV